MTEWRPVPGNVEVEIQRVSLSKHKPRVTLSGGYPKRVTPHESQTEFPSSKSSKAAKMDEKKTEQQNSIGLLQDGETNYPLLMTKIAIENGHL